MKITRLQLEQIIKEELENMKEVSLGLHRQSREERGDPRLQSTSRTQSYHAKHGMPPFPEGTEAPENYINDDLVTAASDAVVETIRGLLQGTLDRRSQEEIEELIQNVKLDIEEPLMDLLMPISKQITDLK